MLNPAPDPPGGQLMVTFSREGENEHMQICEDGDRR